MDKFPFVSVVIPVYNGGKALSEALESLMKQDYPRDKFEVIVVDDGSSDDPGMIVRGENRVLIRQEHKGPSAARNLGINSAKGDIILLLDSDCKAGSDWISRHMRRRMEQKGEVCLGGAFAFPGKGSGFIELCDYYSCWYEQHEKMPYSADFEYLPSTNMSFSRRLALDIGGFDPGIPTGEDVDFCWRLKQKGCKVVMDPEIVVGHRPRATLKGFLLHHYFWGKHAILVRRYGSGKRFDFLFRPNILWAVLMAFPIALGYSLYIMARWVPFKPALVLVLSPMIILAKLSYACGVVGGTIGFCRKRDK